MTRIMILINGYVTKNQNFPNPRWWTEAILINRFWLYLSAMFSD